MGPEQLFRCGRSDAIVHSLTSGEAIDPPNRKENIMRYTRAYRKARWSARPPLRLRNIVLLGMSFSLALADFSQMYELANLAFDSEGIVGLLLAVSVTAATIALPMLTAQSIRNYAGRGEDGGEHAGDRFAIVLSVFTLLSFVAMVAGVFWFRIQFEGQNKSLITAGLGSAFNVAAGTQTTDGALTKSVFLAVTMISTGVVSFCRSYMVVRGSENAVKALTILREHRLQWEVEGELAAERVMQEELALMEEERQAVDAVTDATLALETHLLDLRNVVDPAQAQLVEAMLRELTTNKVSQRTVAPELIETVGTTSTKMKAV